MREGISESQFYMWRAIFAMAHADHVVTERERSFMHDVLREEPFSSEQRTILEEDIDCPQDVTEMFMSIAEQEDRSRFFYFARLLCWSDGDFDGQEQEIILKLKKIHVRNVDIEEMIGRVDMQIDETHKDMLAEDANSDHPLVSFFKRFRGS